MARLKLTRAPERIDELGRPWFAIAQDKGLVEHQSHTLLSAPTAAGYCAAIDRPAFDAVERTVRRFAKGRAVDIVEIGGTTGHFFDRVVDISRTYTNVDPGTPEPDAKLRARLRRDQYLAVRASAEDIPIADGAVDLVLALASLDHIPDVDKALGEIRRILRPRGRVIVTLNNRGSWWKRLLTHSAVLREREREIARDHYVLWTAQEAASRIGQYLEVTSVTTRNHLPYIPRAWPVLLPVANAIGRSILPLGGSITFIVAERASG